MSYTQPINKLNPTQRKSIGAGVYIKRERDENEALPNTINIYALPALKMADAQFVRPGALDFMRIKSAGDPC